jgi:hypothetical protein
MIRTGNWQAFLPACILFAIGYVPIIAIGLWKDLRPLGYDRRSRVGKGIDGHNARDRLRVFGHVGRIGLVFHDTQG